MRQADGSSESSKDESTPNTHEPSPDRPDQPTKSASEAPRPARIALVGHCERDSWMLKGVVARAFPGAEVAMVNDASSAHARAARADLLFD